MKTKSLFIMSMILVIFSNSTFAGKIKEPIIKPMGKTMDGKEWSMFYPSNTTKKGEIKKKSNAEFGIIIDGRKLVFCDFYNLINAKSKYQVNIHDITIEHKELYVNDYYTKWPKSDSEDYIFENNAKVRDFWVVRYKTIDKYNYTKYRTKLYDADGFCLIDSYGWGDISLEKIKEEYFIKLKDSQNDVFWYCDLYRKDKRYECLGSGSIHFQNYAGMEFMKVGGKYYYLFKCPICDFPCYYDLIGNEMQEMYLTANQDIRFIKVIKNGYTGYLSRNPMGKWIVKPVYDFSKKKDDYYGDGYFTQDYITTPDGKGFVKIRYHKYGKEYVILADLESGKHIVSKDQGYTDIDQLKKSPSYFSCWDSHRDYYCICDTNGKVIYSGRKWIYTDETEVIKTPKSVCVILYGSGNYELWINNNICCEASEIKYKNINGFEYFEALAYKSGLSYVIYDINGKHLLPYETISNIEELSFGGITYNLITISDGRKMLLTNFASNKKFPDYYTKIDIVNSSTNKPFLQLKKDGVIKLLNEKLQDIIPPFRYNYCNLVEYNNKNYFLVGSGNYSWIAKWGLIDDHNKHIIPEEYDEISYLGDQYLRVKVGSSCGIITLQGRIIVPTSLGCTWIGNYTSSQKTFQYESAKGKGEINTSGKQISFIPKETQKPVTQSKSSSGSSNNSSRSSSSSQGSSSSSSEPVRPLQPMQVWVPCGGCWGTGTCQTCGGGGRSLMNVNHTCLSCNGSGQCSICHGKGGHYEVQYR